MSFFGVWVDMDGYQSTVKYLLPSSYLAAYLLLAMLPMLAMINYCEGQAKGKVKVTKRS